MTRTHADGSECLQGTSQLPPAFVPCCEDFAAHLTTCAFDVRYEWWSREDGWVIAIAASAGGGGIGIVFCPHCGEKLSAVGG